MRGTDAGEPVYASYFARGAAFLIDWAIVLVLAVFITGGAGADQASRLPVLLVVLSAYHIVFVIAAAATPGKMAMRVHVADTAGGRMTPDRAILRFLIFFVGLPLLPLNVFLLLTDAERRTLHDRFAGTTVRYGRPGWVQDR